MSYTVIARKWRPQTFEDVVGQDHVVQTLRNAIKQMRIAQAYLFVGPRGTGKTTLARIFAKALNCERGPTLTPCGECAACREIAAGTSLDVREIDGASNNSVVDIHGVIDDIKFAPFRGKYRICYIDEVHMLSVPAFNALLKTLEEPPPHAKFIFATTEPEKVPVTVISRCQRFDLRRISVPVIANRLREIAKAEGVTISEDALLAVARGSDGGMRDAQSALDQLIAFNGDKIEENDVLNVFGLVARQSLQGLASAIIDGDVSAALNLVGELDGQGKDLRRLTDELIEHFRNILYVMHSNDIASGGDFTETQVAYLQDQAKRLNAASALQILDLLIQLDANMARTISRRTLLEATLARAARASASVPLEDVLRKLSELAPEELRAAATPGPAANSPAPSARTAAPPPATKGEQQELSIRERNFKTMENPAVKLAEAELNGTVTDIR